MLLALPGGPGGFRELREASRNHFHLSWYLLVPGITSYDQKPLGGNFFVRVRKVDALIQVQSSLRRLTDLECQKARLDRRCSPALRGVQNKIARSGAPMGCALYLL